MNENHKEFITILLTLGLITATLYIVHRFIPSIIWAGIIVIATYPLYLRFSTLFGSYRNLAAGIFTTILSLLFILPLSWFVTVVVHETQLFLQYLHLVNRFGSEAPSFLKDIPWVGGELLDYWNKNVGQPGNIRNFLSNMHLSLTPVSYYVKQIGASLVHRSFQLGFTLITLFFFYRDGQSLLNQMNHIGEYCLGNRWFRYAERLPSALRSTVNGTIVVGIGVGILMGVCYAIVGFPAPALMGFVTAFASMIPFVVPIVFLLVALILFASGSMLAALVVIVWGTLVMFTADHFVKPLMIGGAIKLPFLAVLFGILGGVETLGLLGLFVGPVVMVLFVTLWKEPQEMPEPDSWSLR